MIGLVIHRFSLVYQSDLSVKQQSSKFINNKHMILKDFVSYIWQKMADFLVISQATVKQIDKKLILPQNIPNQAIGFFIQL